MPRKKYLSFLSILPLLMFVTGCHEELAPAVDVTQNPQAVEDSVTETV